VPRAFPASESNRASHDSKSRPRIRRAGRFYNVSMMCCNFCALRNAK
jgi:hypothetical protein